MKRVWVLLVGGALAARSACGGDSAAGTEPVAMSELWGVWVVNGVPRH